MIDEYEVNKYTLAILPWMEENGLYSKIYESELEYIVSKPPIEIIRTSCNYYGSSLSGRVDGTKALIGITHKAPIIMEEVTPLIVFPTHSPRLKECGWIVNNHIKQIKKDGYQTIVEFISNKQISFDLSYGILSSQVLRASRLMVVLKNRNY